MSLESLYTTYWWLFAVAEMMWTALIEKTLVFVYPKKKTRENLLAFFLSSRYS